MWQGSPWLMCILKFILWTAQPVYINMSLLCSFPWKHRVCHLFPACASCLGIVWATVHLALTLCPCKPPVHLFIPQGSRVASSHSFFVVCANLSLVSTSKQKRLSMDSVFRRMQDFSVSCVGPCRGKLESGRYVWWRHWQQSKQPEDINWLYLSVCLCYDWLICWNNIITYFFLMKHLFSRRFLLTRHHDQQSPLLVILAVIFDPGHPQSPCWDERKRTGPVRGDSNKSIKLLYKHLVHLHFSWQ